MTRWRRAAAIAARLQMPYELGRAHVEMARHLTPDDADRIRHLSEAAALFTRIGCAWELGHVPELQEDTSRATWRESSVA